MARTLRDESERTALLSGPATLLCADTLTRARRMARRIVASLVVIALAVAAACRPASLPPDRAILILVSIDGFRWDYLERYSPPALTALAARGVRAEGLIPQFPSKTFPNHYTLVTGLRPAHHGIISNNMVAPDIPGRFAMSNRKVLSDPRWWGGEPIWNTIERQGHLAASMFWPGSETLIGGHRATYWRPFDDHLPNADRVAQVIEWLRLPEGRRPSFLTAYFSDVDSAGHASGPDSTDVRNAVLRVDRSIAALVAGVADAGLADRANFVVVSDHGMATIPPDHFIVLDDYVNPDTVDVVDWAPVLALSPRNGDVDALYAALKGKHPALAVYRRDEVPAIYGLAGHPRLPAVVGIASEGWFVTSRRELSAWAVGPRHRPGGTHGYDVRNRSMHGLFIAAGPRLVRHRVVPELENVHVYDLLCAILGVGPAPNDGDPAVTRPLLR